MINQSKPEFKIISDMSWRINLLTALHEDLLIEFRDKEWEKLEVTMDACAEIIHQIQYAFNGNPYVAK